MSERVNVETVLRKTVFRRMDLEALLDPKPPAYRGPDQVAY